MANTFERIRDHHLPGGGETFRRTIGSPALFTILYASLASAIYFALSVIAEHALGLTPLVFLLGGAFWSPLSHGWPEFVFAVVVIAFAAFTNVRGLGVGRYTRIAIVTVFDL